MKNKITGNLLLLLAAVCSCAYAEVMYNNNTSPIMYIPAVQVSPDKDKSLPDSNNELMLLDEEQLNQTQMETEQLKNWWSHQATSLAPSQKQASPVLSNKSSNMFNISEQKADVGTNGTAVSETDINAVENTVLPKKASSKNETSHTLGPIEPLTLQPEMTETNGVSSASEVFYQ